MIPVWFWIVSGILLLWNAMGCFACFSQLTITPGKLAALPEPQRDAYAAMPSLAKIAYVAAVATGLLGAMMLVVRSPLALPLFVASLAGVIVQFGWFFLVYRGASKLGAGSAGFPAFIAMVGVVQIWFAQHAGAEGWLG